MNILCLFLLAVALEGQTTLTLTGPASALPGSSLAITVTMAGSSGKNLAGAEWTSGLPASMSYSAPVSGAALGPVGKAVYCSASNQTCLFIGLSTANAITNNPAADGAVATLQLSIAAGAPAGSISIPLTGLVGVDNNGGPIAVTSGTPYSILVGSKCDLNGDGVVDFRDAVIVIGGIFLPASCPPALTAGCTMATLQAVLRAAPGACTLP